MFCSLTMYSLVSCYHENLHYAPLSHKYTYTVFSITFVISLLSSEISQGIYDYFFLNNIPANVSGC